MPRPHTPTPWVLVDEGGVITITTDQRLADSCVEVAIVDADFYQPDEAFVNEQRANAEFIVRAVNSHAALLSALEAASEGLVTALSVLRHSHFKNGPARGEVESALDEVSAALALARTA